MPPKICWKTEIKPENRVGSCTWFPLPRASASTTLLSYTSKWKNMSATSVSVTCSSTYASCKGFSVPTAPADSIFSRFPLSTFHKLDQKALFEANSSPSGCPEHAAHQQTCFPTLGQPCKNQHQGCSDQTSLSDSDTCSGEVLVFAMHKMHRMYNDIN